jgi:hypothetical protein
MAKQMGGMMGSNREIVSNFKLVELRKKSEKHLPLSFVS